MSKINQAMIDFRKQLGLSQKEFSILLGLPQGIVSNYENGVVSPGYSSWLKMKIAAKRKGIDLRDEIFCEEIKKDDEVEVVLATYSLKTARKYLAWTRKQMGEVMGVSEYSYARYERGECEPLASSWLKIKYHIQSYGIQLLERVDGELGQ